LKLRPLHDFVEARRPEFFRRTQYSEVTEDELEDAVKEGVLFGMLEVDLAVPQQWQGDFKPSLPPREYFAEVCPLFGTTDIPFEEIGPHMQEHVRQQQLDLHLTKGFDEDSFTFKEPKPRRLLVGVMDAERVLVSTPLLRWYLNHGILLQKIHQVIEFKSAPCFAEFCNQVSEARRAGDADPDKAIIADSMKLLGNSGYVE
jgi:hypothetical protein